MIKPIDLPNGRHYQTLDGLFPSVTTILKHTQPKEACDRLRKWQHKYDLLHGDGAGELVSDQARDRGTAIHKAIAQALFDLSDVETITTPELQPYWNSVRPIVRAIKSPSHCEHSVFHSALKYAGTLDLICDWQGKSTIIDWKTSDRIKKRGWTSEAQLQIAAYKGAYEVMYGVEIQQSLIVIISPERSQLFLFEPPETKQHWEAWEKRLKEYYELLQFTVHV